MRSTDVRPLPRLITSHLTSNPHPTPPHPSIELSGFQSLSNHFRKKQQTVNWSGGGSIVRRTKNMIACIGNYARLMCLVSLNDLALDLYNFDPNIKLGN